MNTRALLDVVYQHDEIALLDPPARRLALRNLLKPQVDEPQLAQATRAVAEYVDGFGPLAEFMRDPAITDVLVNSGGEIWLERDGDLVSADARIAHDELLDLVDRLLARAGARADASVPLADARLPDGSRLHVALPPVVDGGPVLSIRKFAREPLSLADLVHKEMVTAEQAVFLRDAVRDRQSLAISGATGTGKTTLMNALLGEVPSGERVVTLEETPELRPCSEHVVALVTRPANQDGVGAIDLDMLVRAALRMRPDRIVVGEVRGAEALSALGALTTGHRGSMVTVHAGSADDVATRFVTLALMARSGAGEDSLLRRFAAAFDHIVHLARQLRGPRHVAEILSTR